METVSSAAVASSSLKDDIQSALKEVGISKVDPAILSQCRSFCCRGGRVCQRVLVGISPRGRPSLVHTVNAQSNSAILLL
jgi:hypothetical protein